MSQKYRFRFALSFIFFFLTDAVYAALPGTYIGAAVGYSKINTPGENIFPSAVPSPGFETNPVNTTFQTGGAGSQLSVKYIVTSHIGTEFNISRIADSVYKTTQQNVDNSNDIITGSNTASVRVKALNLNLLGKIYFPIGKNLDAFLVGGMTQVLQEVNFDHPAGIPTIIVDHHELATPRVGNHFYSATRPAYGLGIQAQFNPLVGIEMSWITVMKKGNIKTSQNAIAGNHLFALGIIYHLS